jgi:nitroreductase
VDFDCALATENMFIAAQSLGLGAHIYTAPIRNINSKRQEFEIPPDYRAIAVLRIGHIDDSVDAISSATSRKKDEEVVNYVK